MSKAKSKNKLFQVSWEGRDDSDACTVKAENRSEAVQLACTAKMPNHKVVENFSDDEGYISGATIFVPKEFDVGDVLSCDPTGDHDVYLVSCSRTTIIR